MKYLKYLLIISLALLMSSCFASRQNPYARKKRNTHVSTTRLGKNRYFFSNSYQKKLKRNYRKKQY